MVEKVVNIERRIYTASDFAKCSLLYLQEIGKSTTVKENISGRQKLDSFLFLMVLDGSGYLVYKEKSIPLKKGDCAFIDCQELYTHKSNNWTIKWVHFNGKTVYDIYKKFLMRNMDVVFHSGNFSEYLRILSDIKETTESLSYVKDMEINSLLSSLLLEIMKETVYYDLSNKRKYNLDEIKKYIDTNFQNKVSLEDLSRVFFINKFYLTRIFKQRYGVTIIQYISLKRITKSKELLRYSSLSIGEIAGKCGFQDQNYFSREFRKIEGSSPMEYRKMW